MHTFVADIVLAIHFAFVLFVVGGLALIWIGYAAGWAWVRNVWFRAAHLAAIVFVAGEALLGFMCPLTILEDALRSTAGASVGGGAEDKSFIARWVHRVMFYTAPEWVFTTLYVAFALLVAATFWLIPPQRKR
jgi:polyferredoxin